MFIFSRPDIGNESLLLMLFGQRAIIAGMSSISSSFLVVFPYLVIGLAYDISDCFPLSLETLK